MDVHMQRAATMRQACMTVALQAYEEAGISGLCHEGRWAYAVDAMRGLPLRPLVEALLRTAEDEEGGGLLTSGASAATQDAGRMQGWRGHTTRGILRRQGVSGSRSCSARFTSVYAMGSALARRDSCSASVDGLHSVLQGVRRIARRVRSARG